MSNTPKVVLVTGASSGFGCAIVPALRYPRAPAVQRTFNALRPLLPQAVAEFLIRDAYGLKKSQSPNAHAVGGGEI